MRREAPHHIFIVIVGARGVERKLPGQDDNPRVLASSVRQQLSAYVRAGSVRSHYNVASRGRSVFEPDRYPTFRAWFVGDECLVEDDSVLQALQEDFAQCEPADWPLAFRGHLIDGWNIDLKKSVQLAVEEGHGRVGDRRRANEALEILCREAGLQRPVPRCADVETIALQPIRRGSVSFENADLQSRCDKPMSQAQASGSCADDQDVQLVVHGGDLRFGLSSSAASQSIPSSMCGWTARGWLNAPRTTASDRPPARALPAGRVRGGRCWCPRPGPRTCRRRSAATGLRGRSRNPC